MDDDTALTDMAAVLAGGRGIGTVAGRYELNGLLGCGGAADVHEATDTRLDRRVAVKLLRETAASEPDRVRFLSEAMLLGRLSHPHLVRVLDAGVDHDRPFLVLELVRGPTLAEALGEPLPEARVAELGADIASALAHVHAAGVVHRDVKPGNVLLHENGTAMLADFGIARLVDDPHHHTRTGTVVGTVAYLAPEQVAGEQVTTAVDIYALGLVLLEALTGVRPYAGTSVESALARLSRPPAIPASLPPGWRTLLTAMTARDPGARPTAAEVEARLRGGAPAAPARPVHGRQLSPRVALAGAVAAFALLLGAAAWSSTQLPPGAATATAAHRVPAVPSTSAGKRQSSTPGAAAAVVPAAVPASPPAPAPPPTATPHRHHHHHARHHRHHHRHHHHRGHRHHR